MKFAGVMKKYSSQLSGYRLPRMTTGFRPKRSMTMPQGGGGQDVACLRDDHHDAQPRVGSPDSLPRGDVRRDEWSERVDREQPDGDGKSESQEVRVPQRLDHVGPAEGGTGFPRRRLGDEDVQHCLHHAAERPDGEERAVHREDVGALEEVQGHRRQQEPHHRHAVDAPPSGGRRTRNGCPRERGPPSIATSPTCRGLQRASSPRGPAGWPAPRPPGSPRGQRRGRRPPGRTPASGEWWSRRSRMASRGPGGRRSRWTAG